MKITVVQWCPVFGDQEANWARMEEFAAGSASDIIVFPELFSSGYKFESREEILPHSSTAERLAGLSSISAKRGSMIVGGFSERSGTEVYNSAFAIADGRAQVYRKIHLWAKETQIFAPGTRSLIVEHGGARVGVQICYDLQFPELGRFMGSQGVDIIVCPMAWAEESSYRDRTVPAFVHLGIAEAYSNGVFTAIANRVGTERGAVFQGHSGITDPFGNSDGLQRGEGTFTLDANLAEVAAAKKPSPYNDLGRDRKLTVAL